MLGLAVSTSGFCMAAKELAMGVLLITVSSILRKASTGFRLAARHD